MMKKYLMLALICIVPLLSLGQAKVELVNFPSPNAASLGIFGAIPVNNFTGNPDIEIPIYDLNEGNIDIPISLKYHLSSVRLNSVPGWTGLGWNLNAGGAITRVVKGDPDELWVDNSRLGYYYNYSLLSGSDWSSHNSLLEYMDYFFRFENAISPRGELMADVFNFNFLGYSGRFFLDHTGNWVVQSNKPIKVIFDPEDEGIVDQKDLRSPLGDKMVYPPNRSKKYFNKFTLVTDDGTKFEFGGINATEYSTSFKNFGAYVTPTTWYLTKMIYTNNKEVDFLYEPGPLICSLQKDYHYRAVRKDKESVDPACKMDSESGGFLKGFLIFPVYLKEISADNKRIIFDRSNSNSMTYNLEDMTNGNFYGDRHVYYTFPEELQWQKLDQIRVLDKNGRSKIFEFDYTSSSSERLKLLSLKEKAVDGEINSMYGFEYNNNIMPYYLENQADHWGFFNNYRGSWGWPSDENFVTNIYPASREPSLSGMSNKYEILEKVVYPTRGYTTFTYEPHRYSKVVNISRNGLDEVSGIAGGLRIKKIESYTGNVLQSSKEYLYVKNYTGQNSSGLTSSGILNGYNQYHWFNFQGKEHRGANFYYDLFTSSSLLPTPFDDGSHITYSEVVEKNTENGFTIYKYTSYDDAEHRDEAAIRHIEPQRSIYSPFTSKSLERGKLTSKASYSESGIKLHEIKNFYTRSSNNFVRGVFSEVVSICYGFYANYVSAYKHYIYNYNLSRTEEIVYDPNGLNPVSNIRYYEYNNRNQLIKQTVQNVDNRKIISEHKYPGDFSDTEETLVLKNLRENHIINLPVETKTYMEPGINNDKEIIDAQYVQFKEFVTWKPEIIYKLNTAYPINYSGFQFYEPGSPNLNSLLKPEVSYNYDLHGNVSQIRKQGDDIHGYLWDYEGQYPIAHISNCEDLKRVAYTSFETNERGGWVYYDNVIEHATRAKTGKRFFSGGALIYKGDLPWGNYKLSLFASKSAASIPDGNIVVTDASPKTVTSSAQWQYLEWDINFVSPTQFAITIPSGIIIDELRIYPTEAKMTTYTYDLLAGVTSETDPNGYTTYYEYDKFYRLKYVRDFNRNIIKTYDYNYAKCQITRVTGTVNELNATLTAVGGAGAYEYSLWQNGVMVKEWQQSNTFFSLNPGEVYTPKAREAGNIFCEVIGQSLTMPMYYLLFENESYYPDDIRAIDITLSSSPDKNNRIVAPCRIDIEINAYNYGELKHTYFEVMEQDGMIIYSFPVYRHQVMERIGAQGEWLSNETTLRIYWAQSCMPLSLDTPYREIKIIWDRR